MAIKTTLQQIEDVQEAITQSEASLEMAGPGGDRVVRNRLDVLYKRLDFLKDRYRREKNTGGPVATVGYMRGY